jgi:hypothetical protein
MLKISYQIFLTLLLVVFGLNASALSSSNAKSNTEEIRINDRFVELEKGFSRKSIDNKYTATVTKFNEKGFTVYEPGIITVHNDKTGEEQTVEIKDYHEAINDLIWTKHDILLIFARENSVIRYICSYDPEKKKKIFEADCSGDGFALSPDNLKLAILKVIPRFNTPPDATDNILISFDIRNQEPKEMHPSKEYDSKKHEYFRTLKWNADSNKLAFIEKSDDNSVLKIWHFNGEKVSDEVINDVETNQHHYPNSITKFDNKNINVEYLDTLEDKIRKITDKKIDKIIPLK